jgi:hypothetical protein
VLLTAIFILIALVVGETSAAAVRSPTFSKPISAGPNAELTGVSCMAGGVCLAVDYSGARYLMDGTRIQTAGTTGGAYLFAVSCTSHGVCVAVGNDGEITLTPTSSVTRTLEYADKGAVHWESISCSSPDFCGAGGGIISGRHSGSGVIATWNGRLWSPVKIIDPVTPSETHNFISTMTCIGRRFCVAADGNNRAFQWTGSKWSSPRMLNAPAVNDSFSISCTATTFCLAIGDTPADVKQWNGSRWSLAATSHLPSGQPIISCSSPTFCVAVDTYGNAETWDGSVWSPSQLVDPGGYFDAVSCSTTRICEAVDGEGKFVSVTDGHGPAACAATGCGNVKT